MLQFNDVVLKRAAIVVSLILGLVTMFGVIPLSAVFMYKIDQYMNIQDDNVEKILLLRSQIASLNKKTKYSHEHCLGRIARIEQVQDDVIGNRIHISR